LPLLARSFNKLCLKAVSIIPKTPATSASVSRLDFQSQCASSRVVSSCEYELRVILFPSLFPVLRNRFQYSFTDKYNACAHPARCSAPSPNSLPERLDGEFLIDIPLDDQVNITYVDPETEGVGAQNDSRPSVPEVGQGCRFPFIVDRGPIHSYKHIRRYPLEVSRELSLQC